MENSKTVNKVNYKLTSLSQCLSERALKYFVTGYKCDVVFITKEDNQKIPAHRFMLACASEYFERMFNTELKQNNDSNEYVINGIDGPTLKSILQSIYSQSITVSDENCVELFEAAYLMSLKDIEEVCLKFMFENVTTLRSIEFLTLAQVYSNEDLSEMAVDYIFKHFPEVIKSEEFLDLPVYGMKHLLSGTGIHSPSEEEIFEAFQNWIEFDLENRNYYIERLISLIRLPLMERKYFWNTVDKWMQRNGVDQRISRNVGKWHAIQEIDADLKHMTIRRKYEGTMISIECSKSFVSFHSIDYKSYNNTVDEHLIKKLRGKFEGHPNLLCHDNTIIIYDSLHFQPLWKFDLITSLLQSYVLPDLTVPDQCLLTMCQHDESVYIFHANETKLFWKQFNIKENTMSPMKTFNDVEKITNAVTIVNDIYFMQWVRDRPNVLKQLDVEELTLKDVVKMVKITGNCKLAVDGDTLYAIGVDRTVECFNTSGKSFQVLYDGSNENEICFFHAVCIRKKRIICVGNKGRQIQSFDIVKKTWEVLRDKKTSSDDNYVNFNMILVK